MVVVDDPGSRDGIYARALMQSLKSISPVEIRVSDEPAPSFGNFFKLKDTLSREGGNDGYFPQVITVWGMSTDILAEPITQELNMDISDMNVVIVTELIPYMMVQRREAPWGRKFADFVKYAKANPGKVKYQYGIGTGVVVA